MPYKLKHKLHMLKTYEVPEDDQQFRTKHIVALTNQKHGATKLMLDCTRVGTLIVATIYLQLIQNRYMFHITVLQCSHQHCVQPVASDVEFVGYL